MVKRQSHPIIDPAREAPPHPDPLPRPGDEGGKWCDVTRSSSLSAGRGNSYMHPVTAGKVFI